MYNIESTITDQTHNQDRQQSERRFKDTLFRSLFSEPERFLELYNAISGAEYPEDTEITPCPPNPLFEQHNDLAFLMDSKLIIMCEHQSTINPNMPLRFLLYLTDVLQKNFLDNNALFGRKLVKIPAPELYVLYNGKEHLQYKFLKLSDAFEASDNKAVMELTAKIIDIKYSNNSVELKRSVHLNGYSYVVSEIEANIDNGMKRDAAVRNAIKKCCSLGVLKAFITDDFERTVEMLIMEYDREAEKSVLREEGREEGREEKSILIAQNLIAMKMSNIDISKATGLSIDMVNDLSASINTT